MTDATKQRPLQGYSSAAEAGMAEAWATGSAPTEALWMYRAMRASGATPDEIRKDIDVSEAELARLEMLIRHHALSPFRVERMLEFRRAVLRSFNKLVEQENRQAANVPVVPALPQERGPQLTLCINPRWR